MAGRPVPDPTFGSLWELTIADGQVTGSVRYRYAGSKVPPWGGQKEVRRFGLWVATAKKDEPFGRSINAFFRLMLPDVPPGPAWLHKIAMVGYDFLSDGGRGWENDVRELARWLTPEERRRVALCLHGWYEDLGGYSFDDAKKEIKPQWVAMGRTRKVPMSRKEVRRRLELARGLGFRTLLYFGTALTQDDGARSYRPDWDLVTLEGKKRAGWAGPDTLGRTFMRNPAHPQVIQWYQDYLAALLGAFGPALDGFVWDSTFYIRVGTVCRTPRPAYCDRAMFGLVKTLTAQVNAADRQKVFLTSDCLPWWIGANVPGYGMVADGTFQEHGVRSRGLVLWAVSQLEERAVELQLEFALRFSVHPMGRGTLCAPVAISNGWGDDRGPSQWTPEEREEDSRAVPPAFDRPTAGAVLDGRSGDAGGAEEGVPSLVRVVPDRLRRWLRAAYQLLPQPRNPSPSGQPPQRPGAQREQDLLNLLDGPPRCPPWLRPAKLRSFSPWGEDGKIAEVRGALADFSRTPAPNRRP